MAIRDEYSPYEKTLNFHYRLKKLCGSVPGFATLLRMSVPRKNRYAGSEGGEEKAGKIYARISDPESRLIGIGMDTDIFPYYTKFRRFCIYNGLEYRLIDMHRSDWMKRLEGISCLVWRPLNAQWAVREALDKIKIAADSGLPVFPPLYDMMIYENKNMQYCMLKNAGLNAAETFVSYDYKETVAFIKNRARWPVVSKVKVGSASKGVTLLKDRRSALRFAGRAFRNGVRYSWHADRQKGYVYFQDFIPNQGYDLRVYTAGDRLFGYYRFPGKNDFRASGAGKWAFDALPRDALETALRVRDGLGLADCAVDYVRDREGRLHIIEVSLFTLIDSPAQCRIDDVPGWYEKDGKGGFSFKEGQVWPHDLMLKRFLEDVFPPDESRGEKKRSPFSLFGVPAE